MQKEKEGKKWLGMRHIDIESFFLFPISLLLISFLGFPVLQFILFLGLELYLSIKLKYWTGSVFEVSGFDQCHLQI